jgi:CRP/FNR family cyclic AMP-dependent transcriptional regulator
LFPPAGKEATITLLSAGDFVGEEALAAMAGLRLATATAITACTALRISREEMIRVMHEEHSFSDLFLKFHAGAQHAHSGRSGRSAFQLQ